MQKTDCRKQEICFANLKSSIREAITTERVREHFERVDKVIREKEREIPGFRQTCAGWTDRHTL